jgi:hypothetical protein
MKDRPPFHSYGESIWSENGEEWIGFPPGCDDLRLLTPILIMKGLVSCLHTEPFSVEVPRPQLALWTRWTEGTLTSHLKKAQQDGLISFRYEKSTTMLHIDVLYVFDSPNGQEASNFTPFPLSLLGWSKAAKCDERKGASP